MKSFMTWHDPVKMKRMSHLDKPKAPTFQTKECAQDFEII